VVGAALLGLDRRSPSGVALPEDEARLRHAFATVGPPFVTRAGMPPGR
jgi:hypothetical protein